MIVIVVASGNAEIMGSTPMMPDSFLANVAIKFLHNREDHTFYLLL